MWKDLCDPLVSSLSLMLLNVLQCNQDLNVLLDLSVCLRCLSLLYALQDLLGLKSQPVYLVPLLNQRFRKSVCAQIEHPG